MRVAALYRYPVKGFAPEQAETLTILESGRVAGDRVLGFRFASSATADDAWGSKHEFVALVNTPGLARLELRFDERPLRLRFSRDGAVLADEPLTEAGRKRIAAAMQEHVLGLSENPLAGHAERLPLRLVGDGVTPRFQDSAADHLTLHGRESLAAVAAATGTPDLSEERFRSNIAVEGLEAWAEQGWAGRRIRIGQTQFQFVRRKGRCLATHANPRTGERDLPLMKLLVKIFPDEKPIFAVALAPLGGGGVLRVGDKVSVVD
jgi:uncharacterized protein YcbX